MKVKKAVILGAGFGTRMLPATKAVPKEMLTIVDRPSIQYIVEELVASGIEDILIVLSRGKAAVMEHFDRNLEIEAALAEKNKSLHDDIIRISGMANITYARQQVMKGSGSAVMYAESFAGDDPIVVVYPDDIMVASKGAKPVTAQICAVYEEYGSGSVAIKPFPMEEISKYSSLDMKLIKDNIYKVTDMIEKPKPEEAFTNYSILGRCVLPAKIFGILKNTKPGLGGEIWLTDAMKTLARSEGMTGVDFGGVRYDTGNKFGLLQAVTEIGLAHEEVGAEYRLYLKDLLNAK